MQIFHPIIINVVLAFMIIASFLAAVTLHECGHALAALLLGDPTPRNEGRLSLRLTPHIDSMGTLLCVILAFYPTSAALGVVASLPSGLGWGKSVKPDPWKMRVGANTGVLIVACAGILASLLIGLVTALLLYFLLLLVANNQALFGNVLIQLLLQLLSVFAVVNISMAIFNILPLYPLDGYQIVYTLLPSKQAVQFARSAPYGPFIILFIFFLLPFLAQLAGLGGFPIFNLPLLITSWSINIAGLLMGPGGTSLVTTFYAGQHMLP